MEKDSAATEDTSPPAPLRARRVTEGSLARLGVGGGGSASPFASRAMGQATGDGDGRGSGAGSRGGVSGRVALVTGASGALGGAIARRLGEAGALVACHYHGSEQRAQAVADAIRAFGSESMTARADVSNAQEVDALVAAVIERWGRIDILVHCAGITRDTLVMRMSEADWIAVITTNLTSAFLCNKAVVRSMLRQRYGRILNISSVVGLAGNVGQANYAAAKAGVIGLTRSLAREVATRGITVNALAPGFIDAGMTETLKESVRERVLTTIPAGRFGTAEDVAETALFFCGEGAGYITGQVLPVDGGMVMA